MNYHLMIDDKFIDEFIIDAEKVACGQNVYIFTFDKPTTHVKSDKGINAPYGSVELKEIVRRITKTDRVYIHWFVREAMWVIDNIDHEVPIYLFFLGGDFLEQTSKFFNFNFEDRKSVV